MAEIEIDEKAIPTIHLQDLERAVGKLNALVAELIERHGADYDIRMWPRVPEDEPPRVEVSITRVFARFGDAD
ncbi:hypothetical protein ASE63_22585 [Bosea sp. Root381]|uniref:hypothetical protein n=1 Tax=Bosea sp. Root381 TaxID=1736524 RepID=UPI0006F83FA4|nr:hypothetical protein [Bosea sp. Root381]KRE07489.1 hypothetical protein ASE63_22585 [Bosea sp. Root381]